MTVRIQAIAVTAIFLAHAAQASTVTAASSWTGNNSGTLGYVQGRPLVAGGVVYGVIGYQPVAGASTTGFVYSLTPPASGTTYTQASITSFSGGANGGNPVGGLYADASGNLYGAAYSGGTTTSPCPTSAPAGCGLIFELTKSGTTWTSTILHKFAGGTTDGQGPMGNLVADSAGNLYGVAEGGGISANGGCTRGVSYEIGCGVVFKLTAGTGGTYTYSVIYSFKGGTADGAFPIGPLAVDSKGNVYGVTQFGGTAVSACGTLPSNPFGNSLPVDGRCGTVYKLTYNSSANTYSEVVLHLFADEPDGSIPSGGVVLDKLGNLYGTTWQGGSAGTSGLCVNLGVSGCGVVFEIPGATTASAAVTPVIVHTFLGGDGQQPSALLLTGKRRLMGVTTLNSTQETCSSTYYCGTAFLLTPPASGNAWHAASVYKFSGSGNALTGPEFGLAPDTLGHLFGVSVNGFVSSAWVISTPASGTLVGTPTR